MLTADPGSFDVALALASFARDGYARLGVAATRQTTLALGARIDDLMAERVGHAGLFFQRDSLSGRYEDLSFGQGWQGPSHDYRKIEKLERDPLFWQWITNPLFERVARAMIDGPIALYRAVLFTKSKEGGTHLPWHQDGGVFWGLDRAPTLQLWTALDDCPQEAGCVEVVDGTHHQGLVTPQGGVIPDDVLKAGQAESRARPLPARAGEVFLIHNHLWHRSGVNRTGQRRSALSVCLMSAETRCLRKKRAPREFVRVFE